jgi:hypothetical protein
LTASPLRSAGRRHRSPNPLADLKPANDIESIIEGGRFPAAIDGSWCFEQCVILVNTGAQSLWA